MLIKIMGFEFTGFIVGFQEFVSVADVCATFGLNEDKQLRDLREKCSHWAELQTIGGACCIPKGLLPMWLARVKPQAVRPDKRDALRSFHLECRGALNRAFLGREAVS